MKFLQPLDLTSPTEERAGSGWLPGPNRNNQRIPKPGNAVVPLAVLMRKVYSSKGVDETKDCCCGEELTPGRLSNSVWLGDLERAKDHNGTEGYGDSRNIKKDYTNS